MLRTVFLAICLIFTLAGCGQKGDLYLPAQSQQSTSHTHG